MAMNLGLGLKSLIGFAPESAWGTFVDPTHFSRCISLTPTNKTTTATDPEMTEDMDVGVYWMINDAGCDIVMNNLYEGDELFWHSLLGKYDFTQPQAGEGSHLFSYDPSNAASYTLPGLSIGACFFEAPDTGDNRWIGMEGGHVTKVVVEGNANDFLRTTWTLTGKSWKVPTDSTFSTPTYPARLPVLGVHAGNSGGAFKLGDTAVKAADWRLTLEVPRAEGRYHYGQSAVAEPVRVDKLRGTIEATCELDLTTDAGWDLYKQSLIEPETAQTKQNLEITHIGSTIVSADYKYGFQGDFLVMGDSPSISDGGIVTFNLRGNLIDDSASVGGVTVNIINSTDAKVTT